MKVILLTLTAALAAYAQCPNVSGTYRCEAIGGEFPEEAPAIAAFTQTQDEQTGAFELNVNLDGKTQTYSNTNPTIQRNKVPFLPFINTVVRSSLTCKDQKIEIQGKASYEINAAVLAKYPEISVESVQESVQELNAGEQYTMDTTLESLSKNEIVVTQVLTESGLEPELYLKFKCQK